jgi:Flp pilus assembly protein CpaB
MVNKSLLVAIVVLLTTIAGYLSYLAWDRHQHNAQEELAHQQEIAFRSQFLGVTPQQYEAQEKADAAALANATAESK